MKNKKGKHKKKYNYKNILILLLFIITSIILICDFYMITIKLASYTIFGLLTGAIILSTNIACYMYIEEELKKIK